MDDKTRTDKLKDWGLADLAAEFVNDGLRENEFTVAMYVAEIEKQGGKTTRGAARAHLDLLTQGQTLKARRNVLVDGHRVTAYRRVK